MSIATRLRREERFSGEFQWIARILTAIETDVLGNASRRIQHFYREHPRLCATLSENRANARTRAEERREWKEQTKGRAGGISMSNSFISRRRTSHGNPGFLARSASFSTVIFIPVTLTFPFFIYLHRL